MKVRTGLLAALALSAFTDAGHARHGHYPHQASAAGRPVPSQSDSGSPAGTDGTVRSTAPRSQTGNAAGGATENAEHQPAVKPGPGNPVRESVRDSPIDTRTPFYQGQTANKGSQGIGVAVRALAQRLRNRSGTAIAPGVAVRHDAYGPQQKPAPAPAGAGVSFPARNAIGAAVEPHAARHDAVQASAPAATLGLAAATDHNRAMQQISRPVAAAHGLAAMSAGGPAVNGTAMIRPGAGAGAIGGPPKAVAGVISGANVRMRHP
jgi:hypothetical protein